jgi:hypothetical protein
MYRKIFATAGTAVAIVGVATAALATSGSDPSNTSGTGRASGQSELHAILRHALHGQVTTGSQDGYVTHSGVRGMVTAVSPTSITVKAVDGYTETFTLGPDTKARERTPGQRGATSGSVSDVKRGDQVAVLGKAPEHSSAAPIARVVIDGLRKK